MHITAVFLLLVWLAPPLLRSWRMARFYQIEEYKVNRFWTWLVAKRRRWFPRQPAMMMLAGIVAAAVLQVIDVSTPLVHLVIWLMVCAVVSLPEPVKETKKEFVRTQRAMRIVGTAAAVLIIFMVGGSLFATRNMASDAPQELSTVAIWGYIAFLISPLVLPLANTIMYPVEAALRRRFRERARQRLLQSGVTTIGITGSYGKTSTKTYLDHLLSGRYKVLPTPKSYNTLMGVSLAINNDLDPNFGYQYFIAEMGAYVPGEIAEICQLVQPKISIVTAVGPMHLERFGSIENVVKAKYEIVQGLPKDGIAIFNGDDPNVRGMAEKSYPDNRILVSREGLDDAQIVAESIQQTSQGLTFNVRDKESDMTHPFKTSLIGLHNVTNILLATAAARHIGLSLSEIGMRVATLEPAEHRLRQTVMPGNITILDDAYSANPVGSVNALDVLKLYDKGRRILITPGMVELGTLQEAENYKLGTLAAAAATDIVLVGIEQTQPIQQGIANTDFDPDHLLVVDTFQEAREWFQAEVKAGDTVLFLNDLPDTYL